MPTNKIVAILIVKPSSLIACTPSELIGSFRCEYIEIVCPPNNDSRRARNLSVVQLKGRLVIAENFKAASSLVVSVGVSVALARRLEIILA